VKLYQRRDVNETLSSTLEIVLKQIRVLIAQSNILQREYRKRDLAVPCKGTSLDCLDNLVGLASSSVPTDPRSPRS